MTDRREQEVRKRVKREMKVAKSSRRRQAKDSAKDSA
jgi:hypothetical protein